MASLDPVLIDFCALLLALVFASAAWGKFVAWTEFEGVVGNYRLLPRVLVVPVAKVLPPIEVVLAIGVLVPATRAPSAALLAVLLAVFGAAIAINVARGRVDIDCGCFRAAHKQNLSWWLVLRNALLVLAALACTLEPVARDTGWAESAVSVLAALTVFTSYLSIGGVTLRRPPTFDENHAHAVAQRS
jgi:uncharacterized membrane protein